MRIHLIDKYSELETFKPLNEKDIEELKNQISPLIISTDDDELAKRFDYLMYTIQFGYLEKRSIDKPRGRVIGTAEKLETKGTIDQVRRNAELIREIQTEVFWEEADAFNYEEIRQEKVNIVKDIVSTVDKVNGRLSV